MLGVSFLADDILRMRYVSINGQFRKMLLVIKMRRSEHSIDMHEYQIRSKGIVMGDPMRGYSALTSGIPQPWSITAGQQVPELRTDEPIQRNREPRPRKKPGRKRPSTR